MPDHSDLTVTVTNGSGEVLFVGRPVDPNTDRVIIEKLEGSANRLRVDIPDLSASEQVQDDVPGPDPEESR